MDKMQRKIILQRIEISRLKKEIIKLKNEIEDIKNQSSYKEWLLYNALNGGDFI